MTAAQSEHPNSTGLRYEPLRRDVGVHGGRTNGLDQTLSQSAQPSAPLPRANAITPASELIARACSELRPSSSQLGPSQGSALIEQWCPDPRIDGICGIVPSRRRSVVTDDQRKLPEPEGDWSRW